MITLVKALAVISSRFLHRKVMESKTRKLMLNKLYLVLAKKKKKTKSTKVQFMKHYIEMFIATSTALKRKWSQHRNKSYRQTPNGSCGQ
ncbi:CLUMA_CG006822, isoform A [Clunio marinus]|uniref:CLUMA_CG006822, isoform A n=1 Tax=Clunio marinus TaxID=568069 RepID=A0A1J1HYV5_9DIPT|nr:CLUMA_CG006822, isoform A [Clunio marinus]